MTKTHFNIAAVSAMEHSRDIVVTLRPEAGEPSPDIQLRKLLKRLGRAYGFKVMDIREVPANQPGRSERVP